MAGPTEDISKDGEMNNKGETMKENKQAQFLDALLEKMNLKNDAALSRAMGVTPSVLCKLRKERLPFGPSYRIIVHEMVGWSFADMRKMLGEPERKVA